MYLLDHVSNTRFLVDSGAEVSLFPASTADKARGPHGPALIAANGSPIESYGTKQINISVKGRFFSWKFIICDISQGIIGADFLRNHG